MAIFTRKETPPSLSGHREYKPYLRKDFLCRCAYCERTETSLGGEESFEVDHFRPKKKYPDLTRDYRNLYYSCRGCNGHKWEWWPTEQQIASGLRFADPCIEDPYLEHLRERDDGGLEPLTPCGAYSNAHIRLDRPDVKEWRRQRGQALRDLPIFAEMARKLELALASSAFLDKEAAQGELAALKRRIEESKLRFSIAM